MPDLSDCNVGASGSRCGCANMNVLLSATVSKCKTMKRKKSPNYRVAALLQSTLRTIFSDDDLAYDCNVCPECVERKRRQSRKRKVELWKSRMEASGEIDRTRSELTEVPRKISCADSRRRSRSTSRNCTSERDFADPHRRPISRSSDVTGKLSMNTVEAMETDKKLCEDYFGIEEFFSKLKACQA